MKRKIDLGKILLKFFSKEKYLIIFTTLIFLISAFLYLYFIPNNYKSFLTIKFDNFNRENFSQNGFNLTNEIEIIKSRYMISKLLNKIEIKYYKKQSLKEVELYQNLPFVVSVDYLTNDLKKVEFELKIKKNNSFELKSLDKNYNYQQNNTFSNKITTSWFSFKINNIYKLKKSTYRFVIYNDKNLLIDEISKNLKVTQPNKKTAIIKIHYQDNIALKAKDRINQLAKIYLKYRFNRRIKNEIKPLKFIDRQLNIIAKNLKNYQNELQENGLIRAIKIDRLTIYERKISKIDLQLAILFNLQHFIIKGKDISKISMVGFNLHQPLFFSMIKELEKREKEIKILKLSFKNFRIMQNRINSIKKHIQKSILDIKDNLLNRREILKEKIEKEQKTSKIIDPKEKDMIDLKKGFLVNQKLYFKLLEKRTNIAIAESSIRREARILDLAIKAEEPITYSKRYFIISIFLFLGVIIGIFLGFIKVSFNNKIQTYEDIEKLTNIPIYGFIPFLKEDRLKGVFGESFKSIKTNLDFLVSTDKGKIITISSNIEGEGKSTIILNLAKLLSINSKTLVIDFDIRNPKLAKKLNVNRLKGVSQYLNGELNLKEIIAKSGENLDIIPAGELSINFYNLLNSKKLDELFDILSKRYDYILLNSFPLISKTQTILIEKSQICLMIVRSNYSTNKFIKNINQLSKNKNIKSLAIILNGVVLDKKYYQYCYGY